MFSNPMVEIEARPALIGLPGPQKHFNLNCCGLGLGWGWGHRREAQAMIEMFVLEGIPEAGASQLWGWRWEQDLLATESKEGFLHVGPWITSLSSGAWR